MRRVTLIGLAAVVVLLVVAQLVLPSIGADQIRSQLSARGHVVSVKVSAFPAIKLLWQRADSVDVRMTDLRANISQTGDLLNRAHSTGRLDAHIDRVELGPLTMHDVYVRKRSGTLTATAMASPADLSAALPPGFSLVPVASGGGQLVFRASASLLGVGLTAEAALEAREGRLVVEPLVPFGGLVALTVFADPRVDVRSVGATATPGGFTFTASATLH